MLDGSPDPPRWKGMFGEGARTGPLQSIGTMWGGCNVATFTKKWFTDKVVGSVTVR